MPSSSLTLWRTDRRPRLRAISDQCLAVGRASPTDPRLEDENIRGYLLLLSAHFQGFCRDLYTECAQVIVSGVGFPVRSIFQDELASNRKLDRGNPNLENLRRDFDRLGSPLDLAGADPANPVRLADLANLNRWRNIAAHHGVVPMGGPPTRAMVETWEISCDGLATSLDRIMYDQIAKVHGSPPWVP